MFATIILCFLFIAISLKGKIDLKNKCFELLSEMPISAYTYNV